MGLIAWFILLSTALLAWAALCRWLLDNPRRDFETGIVFRFSSVYARVVHLLRAHGRENIPAERRAGPIIVVANHTAGIDPILIQSVCPFEIRWMMASDMRLPALDWFWNWAGVIIVDRFGRDRTAARQAIRHLKRGGVLGIFPEGGIERPPRQILPFLAGVGLLIRRTGAPVLPVIITGTPQVDPAWASLWRPSRSRLRFMPVIHYKQTSLSPEQIAGDLRQRYLHWTGWPPNDEPSPEVSPAAVVR